MMKHAIGVSAALLSLLWLGACAKPTPQQETKKPMVSGKLTAKTYNSGFALAHDTYNGMLAASDGKIYYVLSAEPQDVAGQMFVYDPATDKTKFVGDLTEACGEKGMNVVSQGKAHVNFVESNGKLYFATHLGYYSIIDDMEKPGVPTKGYKPYRGGHFLSYDMATGKFEDLGLEPHGEGILTMAMDTQRGRLYGLTWPTGYFIRYDMAKKEMKDLGKFNELGENGKGKTYRTICRSFAIDPRDGAVYFSVGSGTILRYNYETETVTPVQGDDLKKDYFGLYDITSPGHMAYNWRQVFWYAPENMFYGVHGNSGYLFRFDPKAERVEVLDRLTSLPSQRSGMYDQFSYGYLGFTLGPDGRTIHYLTGAPIYVNGKRVRGAESTARGEAKGLEDLHLVTYDIPTAKYKDQGAIFYENGERPGWVNSIAVGKDGAVYFMARMTENGKMRADLVKIPGPFKSN